MEAELARSFADDVRDRYAKPFVDLLVGALEVPERPIQALDLACGVGYATLEVIKHLPPGSRIIAHCCSRPMLQELHTQLSVEQRHVIFPRKERPDRIPFAPNSLDLAWACMYTRLLGSIRTTLRRTMRALRPGGRLIICAPLAGSFMELTNAIAGLGEANVHELLADRAEMLTIEQWTRELTRVGGRDISITRFENKLNVNPPAARDRLIARHLLPIWLGRDGDDQEAIKILDRAIVEELHVTVRVGCISAIRGPESFDSEESGRYKV